MTFDWNALWEAIKLPLRVLVFALVGYLLDFGIVYFTQSTLPIAPVVTVLLTIIDKYKHEIEKADSKKPLEGWSRGLLPF